MSIGEAEHDRFKCFFRFLMLNKELSDTVKECFSISAEDVNINRKGDGYVVIIDLQSEDVCQRVVRFAKATNVDEKLCDVFVSIRTDYDSRIYAIPEFVRLLICSLQCPVNVSFTHTGD